MVPPDKNYIEKSDNELVALSLKKKEFYRYLIERYEKKLIRYIMRLAMLRNEDAEDILQEVFIKVYINLNDFDKSLKFSSWIYRITHNETINYLRKRKSRLNTSYSDINEIIINNIRADLDIEGDIDKKYLKNNIEKAMSSIDKKYQEVLILKYMESKDYKEISDILRKPIGTVATLLKRAKEQLKKQMQKSEAFF